MRKSRPVNVTVNNMKDRQDEFDLEDQHLRARSISKLVKEELQQLHRTRWMQLKQGRWLPCE